MHKKVYTAVFLLFSLVTSLSALAQDTAASKNVDMADGMRANGKIYVVIAVAVTILLGLIGYVTRLDRKISRFEKDFE